MDKLGIQLGYVGFNPRKPFFCFCSSAVVCAVRFSTLIHLHTRRVNGSALQGGWTVQHEPDFGNKTPGCARLSQRFWRILFYHLVDEREVSEKQIKQQTIQEIRTPPQSHKNRGSWVQIAGSGEAGFVRSLRQRVIDLGCSRGAANNDAKYLDQHISPAPKKRGTEAAAGYHKTEREQTEPSWQ